MASIFSKIINREIPGYIVAENNDFLAFLDINPLVVGHTLVVPKKEIDYIYDLDDDLLAGLHIFCKKVAKAIESVEKCDRIGVAIIGLEVPHAHVHLVPISTMDDINFSRPKLSPVQEELSETAMKIKAAFTS